MRFFFLLLILFHTSPGKAAVPSLGIYIIPSANKLDWSSTISLMKSFQRSLAKSAFKNGMSDAPKRAIGHAVVRIQCSGFERWSSISIDSHWTAPLILKNGIDGMFAESSHGYMQSEGEIKKFLFNNSDSAVVVKLNISEENCKKILVLDDAHRVQKTIWFGPLINTLGRYHSEKSMGGTGSTYAVAMVKLAESRSLDLDRWLETVRIPGSGKKRTFFSVQSMWDFAVTERSTFPSRAFSEEIKYQKKKMTVPGVEL